jgi:hypothetical protein
MVIAKIFVKISFHRCRQTRTEIGVRGFFGLWLDGAAIWAGDKVCQIAKIDEELHPPEHKAGVDKLRQARMSKGPVEPPL